MVAIRWFGSLETARVPHVSSSSVRPLPSALPCSSCGHVSANDGHEPTLSQRSGIGIAATVTAVSRDAGSITA